MLAVDRQTHLLDRPRPLPHEHARRPFTSPKPDAPSCSSELQRRLAIKRHFVPWGSAGASDLPQCAFLYLAVYTAMS